MQKCFLCVIFFSCFLIQSDEDVVFKFNTYSFEGKVNSEGKEVAYFYGIPYAKPVVRKKWILSLYKPIQIEDGDIPSVIFQSRTNDPNLCLGEDGSPIDALLCFDFDIYVSSPVSKGTYNVNCKQDGPSFTFIWHVDILEKDRSSIKQDAIYLARESGALVVILYYRSGFLGFHNLDEVTNVGFDDLNLAYFVILRLYRHFCIPLEKIVYSGRGGSATDLLYSAMNKYPYIGMYALFGPSFTSQGHLKTYQKQKFLDVFHCDNLRCLQMLVNSGLTSFADILKYTKIQNPWLPSVSKEPLSRSFYIPVMYAFNPSDSCSMVGRWYQGDDFPIASKDQLIDAMVTVLTKTGITDYDVKSAALKFFDFHVNLGDDSYKSIFCKFVYNSFGLYGVWNSSFDVLQEVTFINFTTTMEDSPPLLFPFSDPGLRSQLIKVLGDYVEYNSMKTDSYVWEFGRNKSLDSVVTNIYANGSVVFGEIIKSVEFDIQTQIRQFLVLAKDKSKFNWAQIITRLF